MSVDEMKPIISISTDKWNLLKKKLKSFSNLSKKMDILSLKQFN